MKSILWMIQLMKVLQVMQELFVLEQEQVSGKLLLVGLLVLQAPA
ncbi:hypothetical protein [Escherichia coli]